MVHAAYLFFKLKAVYMFQILVILVPSSVLQDNLPMPRREELRFALSSSQQITNPIGRLKRKGLSKLVVGLSVMRNHRDRGVSGLMKIAQVLPLLVL